MFWKTVVLMRKLNKHAIPQILVEMAEKWTTQYIDSEDPRPRVWSNADLIAALRRETHEKCAYCEGVMLDVSFDQVEHILPKSKFPRLVVEWDNLTMACQACNTAKGIYHDESAPLINPFSIDPMDHLNFIGPVIDGKPEDSMGQRTVDKLKLSRPGLVMQRVERINLIRRLLRIWGLAQGSDKETAADVIRDELTDDREFVQTLREYARASGFPVDNQVVA